MSQICVSDGEGKSPQGFFNLIQDTQWFDVGLEIYFMNDKRFLYIFKKYKALMKSLKKIPILYSKSKTLNFWLITFNLVFIQDIMSQLFVTCIHTLEHIGKISQCKSQQPFTHNSSKYKS